MTSLYAMYLLEREGKYTVESDRGFLTYSFFEDKCYLENLFVHPDYRNTHEASKMADKVAEIAKTKGCKKLIGSVVPSTRNSDDSIKVLQAYGFKLDSSTNNYIIFTKDIG
jgi:GNAT superfamily N-acetyltransferase